MKNKLRRYLITGIVVLLPIFLTVNILVISAKYLDNLLGKYIEPYIEHIFGFHVFGLGVVAIILLIFFTGLLATNVLLKKIMPFFENLFLKIPLVYQIYPSIKQLVRFFFAEEKVSFKKVVIFEYPNKDIWTMGFITNEFNIENTRGERVDMVSVYISSAPNPITGFYVVVPKASVTLLDITIEDAFKIIISGGVLMQGQLLNKKVSS